MIETGTVCGRCMRYDHCINPDIDNFFSFNKLIFTSLNNGKGIGITVSAATFDVIVMIIVDFTA